MFLKIITNNILQNIENVKQKIFMIKLIKE